MKTALLIAGSALGFAAGSIFTVPGMAYACLGLFVAGTAIVLASLLYNPK